MIWQFPEIILFLIYGGCLLFIFLYSLVQLHLTVLFRKFQKTRLTPLKAPENWPLVTVQLPIYNERYVVSRLLEAVTKFDYPPEKLQIQVLDDSTDETVAIIAKKVAAYQQQGLNIQHVRRPVRTGYKAGALQHGLHQATGEFVAIFDADFVPQPDFLKKAIPAFTSEKVGVVQARWGHFNANYSVLTQLQAFGLDAHFTLEQCGRNAGNYFINFNGTAGIWRKTCILDAGGWEADTLTEDLDLSYRAQLKNWQFVYLPELVVPAELPPTMAAVKSQQYRWTKGAAETLRKHLGNLWRAPISFSTKLHGTFHLMNSTVFVAVLLAALTSLPLLFLPEIAWGNLFFRGTSVFLSGFLLLFLFYWLAYRHGQKADFLVFLPRFLLFLLMMMGLSLHNSLAVLEGFSGRKTPFVRTPKFNLTDGSGTWKNRTYVFTKLPALTWLEGILAVVFALAVVAAFWRHDFRLVVFHGMLALGYGLVFGFALKDRLAR